MLIIQIVLTVFFLFAIIKVFSRYRSQELKFSDLVLWTVFWLLAATVVLWPDSTMQLARFMGVGRGVDAVMYLALVFLFFLFFRTVVKIEKMNRDITKLTRKIALNDVGKDAADKK